ncbi:hypothetical protein SAMN02990966_05399 [Rhodospirillales bacterium URHD0017]|nr:hypothetical protein SAMN02990966_05399 [Rhodospirillales bacterium URHD0017]
MVGNSYWTMYPRSAGDTTGWTASEKAAWQGGLALWSAVANIKFFESADAAGANFTIIRGNDGAFADFSART